MKKTKNPSPSKRSSRPKRRVRATAQRSGSPGTTTETKLVPATAPSAVSAAPVNAALPSKTKIAVHGPRPGSKPRSQWDWPPSGRWSSVRPLVEHVRDSARARIGWCDATLAHVDADGDPLDPEVVQAFAAELRKWAEALAADAASIGIHAVAAPDPSEWPWGWSQVGGAWRCNPEPDAAKSPPASELVAADQTQTRARPPSPDGAPKAREWAAVIRLVNQAREAARTRVANWRSLLSAMRMLKGVPEPDEIRVVADELRQHVAEVAAIATALDELASGPSAPSGDEPKAAGTSLATAESGDSPVASA